MPRSATCPSCGRVLQLADDFQRRKVRCPECGVYCEVPGPGGESPSPKPATEHGFTSDSRLSGSDDPLVAPTTDPALVPESKFPPNGRTEPAGDRAAPEHDRAARADHPSRPTSTSSSAAGRRTDRAEKKLA